ncbi:hypothetical protein HOU02_gp337 [Caulobacter phage CcrBL9]|uniref:Uncharacterized protein n=1 Tax=Caulobacter phage CcrBL9 TaxID=2283270 RepID=A0A385EF41_9CAUD|nr:hypothetical protein HOU02_gp337 [Caulobacter phage CcrBL9]AXQ69388.1 hypothetical protein CcrBL9_gp364 [Caulobacter phage CcrBL9]
MSIMTVTSPVSFRYFMQKSKDWLASHIQTLEGLLDRPRTPHSALMTLLRYDLAKMALALHSELPEDDNV